MAVSTQARLWECESKTHSFGAASRYTFQINNLPAHHVVTHIHMVADINVTTAGATGRRPSDIAGLLFAFIEHSSDFLSVRATGYGLDRLFHAMNGKKLQNGPSNAGAATGPQRAVAVIPLQDTRADNPEDTEIPTELLMNKTIEVTTSAATAVNIFGAAAVATCQLRLFMELRPVENPEGVAKAPARTRIDFTDWSGQSVNVDPGVYTHLLIYKEGDFVSTVAAGITPDTEITRVQLTYQGAPIINNVLAWMLVIAYNRTMVSGGFEDNAAEQLDDTTVPFLPIHVPQAPYSLLDLPGGTLPAVLNLAGTLTTVRVLQRSVQYRTPNETRNAARAQLGPGLSVSQRPVTSNGNSIPSDSAVKASLLLPAKLEVS